MVGQRIYIGKPKYEIILKSPDKELNSISSAAYFMRGSGSRGTLSKPEIQEISDKLGIKIIFEE